MLQQSTSVSVVTPLCLILCFWFYSLSTESPLISHASVNLTGRCLDCLDLSPAERVLLHHLHVNALKSLLVRTVKASVDMHAGPVCVRMLTSFTFTAVTSFKLHWTPFKRSRSNTVRCSESLSLLHSLQINSKAKPAQWGLKHKTCRAECKVKSQRCVNMSTRSFPRKNLLVWAPVLGTREQSLGQVCRPASEQNNTKWRHNCRRQCWTLLFQCNASWLMLPLK